jgi:hypothetical protein
MQRSRQNPAGIAIPWNVGNRKTETLKVLLRPIGSIPQFILIRNIRTRCWSDAFVLVVVLKPGCGLNAKQIVRLHVWHWIANVQNSERGQRVVLNFLLLAMRLPMLRTVPAWETVQLVSRTHIVLVRNTIGERAGLGGRTFSVFDQLAYAAMKLRAIVFTVLGKPLSDVLRDGVQTLSECSVLFDQSINVSMERFGVIAAPGDASTSAMPYSVRKLYCQKTYEGVVCLLIDTLLLEELIGHCDQQRPELQVSLLCLCRQSFADQFTEQSISAEFLDEMPVTKKVTCGKFEPKALESRALIGKDDLLRDIRERERVLQVGEPPLVS